MLRFSRVLQFSFRLFQTRSFSADLLLDKLKNCRNEYQVFQLVGMHKALLASNHVSCAINLLWQIQKARTNVCLSLDEVQNHPEFIELQILAENNINYMDDNNMVDVLYAVLRLRVATHNSLVQQLVVEGWNRLERFDLSSLSKFAVCLVKQDLDSSPLLGQVLSILDKRLESLHDLRILSIFMVRLLPVSSPRIQDRLIAKAESLMADVENTSIHTARRILQFLYSTGSNKLSLWEKCIQIVLQNITCVDLNTLCTIHELCHSRKFRYSKIEIATKSRLLECLDLWSNTEDFTRLFCTLLPMASQETKERLEDDLLDLADKIHFVHLVDVLKTMAVAKCRNHTLIHKIGLLIEKHLEHYTPSLLCRITVALMSLPCQNHQLYSSVQHYLIRNLKTCFIPNHVILMTQALFLTNVTHVDDALISKLEAVIPQCNLNQINKMANSTIEWLGAMGRNRPRSYGKLFQKINHQARLKIRSMENIDLLLEEVKHVMNEPWFEHALVEDTLNTCQCLLNQVAWKNVASLATMITCTYSRCTPILDKIAEEATQNITKFSHHSLYKIVRPFGLLNYEPPNGEEFFNACIQQCLANLNAYSPHLLVLLGYTLALAEYFPKELMKAIFNLDFLSRLDSQLEGLTPSVTARIRQRLMQLNRAVCLECPEYQIPWFHDQYPQHMQQADGEYKSFSYHYTRQLLGEVLGGIHFTRMSVIAPYCYPIDIEFLLDKNKNPVSYTDQNRLSADLSNVLSRVGNMVQDDKPLPSGAKRVALQLLHPGAFCRNSSYLKGEVAMKNRHLEILGYSVTQIPSFEWNSMELGTDEARINYLKQKIFGEL